MQITKQNNSCCEISCFLKTTAKKLGDQHIVGPLPNQQVGGLVSPGPYGCCAYEPLYVLAKERIVEFEAETSYNSVVRFTHREVVVFGSLAACRRRLLVTGVGSVTRQRPHTVDVDAQLVTSTTNRQVLHRDFDQSVQRLELVCIQQRVVHCPTTSSSACMS